MPVLTPSSLPPKEGVGCENGHIVILHSHYTLTLIQLFELVVDKILPKAESEIKSSFHAGTLRVGRDVAGGTGLMGRTETSKEEEAIQGCIANLATAPNGRVLFMPHDISFFSLPQLY